MDIFRLARPEIIAMKAYSSARNSASADGILLNANEAPETHLDDPELARLEIANGYQKDDGRFAGNPRVRLMRVEYSSGAAQIVQLFDVKDIQTIEPTSEAVEWVRLVILSVYPGGEWQDTALSEVRIYEKTD